MLVIGRYYTINRKILKKYVDKGWDDTIYYDRDIVNVKIAMLANDNDDYKNFGKQNYYYIDYYGDDYALYLPENCFYDRKSKLERILK